MKLRKRPNENIWVLRNAEEGWLVEIRLNKYEDVEVGLKFDDEGVLRWLGDVNWFRELVEEEGALLILEPVVLDALNGRPIEIPVEEKLRINEKVLPEYKFAVATEEQRRLLELRNQFRKVSRVEARTRYLEGNLSHPERSSTYRNLARDLVPLVEEFNKESGLGEAGYQMLSVLEDSARAEHTEWGLVVNLGLFRQMYEQAEAVLVDPVAPESVPQPAVALQAARSLKLPGRV